MMNFWEMYRIVEEAEKEEEEEEEEEEGKTKGLCRLKPGYINVKPYTFSSVQVKPRMS